MTAPAARDLQEPGSWRAPGRPPGTLQSRTADGMRRQPRVVVPTATVMAGVGFHQPVKLLRPAPAMAGTDVVRRARRIRPDMP
jgi:hypothetical protein